MAPCSSRRSRGEVGTSITSGKFGVGARLPRYGRDASVGDPAPSCGPIAGLRAVPPGLQTPSRALKMVHRAARSRRVITPATTTSRPMTPTMNPRVGAGWGVVTATDAPHRHADSRVHCRRVTRGRRAEKTRPNPAENSTCAPNTISTPDLGCAWPGLRAAGRDFFLSQDGILIYSRRRAGGYIACLNPSRNTLLLTKRPFSHIRTQRTAPLPVLRGK